MATKGGVEMGFMSTSRSKEAAMEYAKMSGVKLVFEVQQGMVARGADISWLSMYPAEDEVLFPPLVACEVIKKRIEGSLVVVELRPGVAASELQEASLQDQEANAAAEAERQAAEDARLRQMIDSAAKSRARWLSSMSSLKVSVAHAQQRQAESYSIKMNTLATAAQERAERLENRVWELMATYEELEEDAKRREKDALDLHEQEKTAHEVAKITIRTQESKEAMRKALQEQREATHKLQIEEMREAAEKAATLSVCVNIVSQDLGEAEEVTTELELGLKRSQMQLDYTTKDREKQVAKLTAEKKEAIKEMKQSMSELETKFTNKVVESDKEIAALKKDLAGKTEMLNQMMKKMQG